MVISDNLVMVDIASANSFKVRVAIKAFTASVLRWLEPCAASAIVFKICSAPFAKVALDFERFSTLSRTEEVASLEIFSYWFLKLVIVVSMVSNDPPNDGMDLLNLAKSGLVIALKGLRATTEASLGFAVNAAALATVDFATVSALSTTAFAEAATLALGAAFFFTGFDAILKLLKSLGFYKFEYSSTQRRILSRILHCDKVLKASIEKQSTSRIAMHNNNYSPKILPVNSFLHRTIFIRLWTRTKKLLKLIRSLFIASAFLVHLYPKDP